MGIFHMGQCGQTSGVLSDVTLEIIHLNQLNQKCAVSPESVPNSRYCHVLPLSGSIRVRSSNIE
ncbi:hypothetical protein RSAG8_05271, partial [Rhizoctonia solani AG-8 WAC10335]